MQTRLISLALLMLLGAFVAVVASGTALLDKATPPRAVMVGAAAFATTMLVGTAAWMALVE